MNFEHVHGDWQVKTTSIQFLSEDKGNGQMFQDTDVVNNRVKKIADWIKMTT